MMKMKRSKHDIIKSAIGSYLKRRHYVDSENVRLADLHLTQTHQQMAVVASIEKESTIPNSFTYSSMTYDMTQVDNQFSSLQTWIGELNTQLNQELSPLITPIFVHLYIEMFLSCPQAITIRFLKRHQALLMNSESDRELFDGLSNAQHDEVPMVNAVVERFRSSKFRAKLSQKSLIMLQKYLVFNGHMALLQVLNLYFDLEIEENPKRLGVDSEPEEDPALWPTVDLNLVKNEPDGDELEGIREVDNTLDELRQAIQTVENDPAPPPKLHLFTVKNNTYNVHCARRLDDDTIAVGWDNEVRLFGPHVAVAPPPVNPVSRIHLGMPNYDPDPPGRIHSDSSIGLTYTTLRGHSATVQDVSSIGDLTLTVSRDRTMRAWTHETGCCVAIYRGHNYPIWSMDVGPLGAVVTGSRDRTARLWTLDRMYPLRIFAGHTQDVESVRFHPNGQYLATGSTDRSVRLWSVTDAKMVRVFAGAWGGVQALAFSPDGRMLAGAGEDKRVRVWDLGAGTLLAELKGHAAAVQDLAWSSDSEQLASCSLDGTLRLWDARNMGPWPQLSVYQTGSVSLLNVRLDRGYRLRCIGAERYFRLSTGPRT